MAINIATTALRDFKSHLLKNFTVKTNLIILFSVHSQRAHFLHLSQEPHSKNSFINFLPLITFKHRPLFSSKPSRFHNLEQSVGKQVLMNQHEPSMRLFQQLKL